MIAARFGLMMLVALVLAPATPAPAQQARDVDRRVSTLESQMRAVQRRVFPGGDSRFFAPEPEPEPAVPTGPPPPNPMVELTQRVDALESQQRQLTGQVEELQFRLRQLESQLERVRGDTEFRLNELEGRGNGKPAAADPGPFAPQMSSPAPAQPPRETARPAPSADPEQAYLAAYGLYTAGDYPGAFDALEAFVKAHPKHARASNAQFWAGRSQMAQQRYPEAARAFLSGYQAYPRGERAHNSLLWLGRALLAMRQPQAACQALDQLRTAFPDRMTGGFAAEVQRTRSEARCPA
ncbi:MAG: tetratricopeptide repeat protein [Thermaurantiacus sp.]